MTRPTIRKYELEDLFDVGFDIDPKIAYDIRDNDNIYAFSVLCDNRPMAVAGIQITSPFKGEAFLILSNNHFKYPLIAMAVKQQFQRSFDEGKFTRVACAVNADSEVRMSFAEYLGFRNEGIMYMAGPDNQDMMLMARTVDDVQE